jgi:ankyrin repeat protein
MKKIRTLLLIGITLMAAGVLVVVCRRPMSQDDINCAAMKGNMARVVELLKSDRNLAGFKTHHDFTPLHWASLDNNVKMAGLLIAAGADVNAATDSGITPLLAAAGKGSLGTACLLLKKGANANFKAKDGDTALCMACRKADYNMVTLLLKHNANVSLRGRYGIIPLAQAAWMDKRSEDSVRERITSLLLANGARVNEKGAFSYTALRTSAFWADKTCELLLRAGADVNAIDHVRRTALYQASVAGNAEACRQLLARGADPNIADIDGETPLHTSISCRRMRYGPGEYDKVTRMLIEAGANPNLKNKMKASPMDWAISSGDRSLVNLLLKHGGRADDVFVALANGDVAKVKRLIDNERSLANRSGCGQFTPLHISAIAGNARMVQLLLNAGAEVNAKGSYGLTPLSLAAISNDAATVEMLLKCGADVKSRDESGTALHHAIIAGSVDAARVLLSHGADINTGDNEGTTPLHDAVLKGDVRMTDFLLSNGADPNVPDENGSTALRYAYHDDAAFEVARRLMSHGLRVNLRDKTGATMLHWVALRGNAAVARLLLDNGAEVNALDKKGIAPLNNASDPETARTLILHGGDVSSGKPGGILHAFQQLWHSIFP